MFVPRSEGQDGRESTRKWRRFAGRGEGKFGWFATQTRSCQWDLSHCGHHDRFGNICFASLCHGEQRLCGADIDRLVFVRCSGDVRSAVLLRTWYNDPIIRSGVCLPARRVRPAARLSLLVDLCRRPKAFASCHHLLGVWSLCDRAFLSWLWWQRRFAASGEVVSCACYRWVEIYYTRNTLHFMHKCRPQLLSLMWITLILILLVS